jgi:hypothetical protein
MGREKYAIEVGTKVMCPNGFEAYVIDKHVQSGQFVCEVSYDDDTSKEDTDIFYMSELTKMQEK